MVITAIYFHLIKLKHMSRAGSNPARGVSEVCNGENFQQWSQSEISLNISRRSTILKKQFIFSGIKYPFLLSYQFQVSKLLWTVSDTVEKGDIPPTLKGLK